MTFRRSEATEASKSWAYKALCVSTAVAPWPMALGHVPRDFRPLAWFGVTFDDYYLDRMPGNNWQIIWARYVGVNKTG